MFRIQWKNKYSGETGFVKCLHRNEGYFENTFDEAEAKTFPKNQVKRTIKLLNEYCADNDYEAVAV